jgi:hypothetical protein
MSPQKPIRMVSRGEEKELLGLGEEILLTDFPNPERLGCPGTEVLKALAVRSGRLSLSERSRWLDHMTCCSPCFTEFSAFVDQARYRKRAVVIGLCAVLLITIGLATWFAFRPSRHPAKPEESFTRKTPSAEGPQEEKEQQNEPAPEPKLENGPTVAKHQPQPNVYREVVLDVRDQAVSRGENPPSANTKYPQVPRGRLNLSIYLPFASEPGKYSVKVYNNPNRPLFDAVGVAKVQKAITILEVRVDTSRMPPGQYVLETRRIGWISGYQYTFQIAE